MESLIINKTPFDYKVAGEYTTLTPSWTEDSGK